MCITNGGQIIRTEVSQVREVGRNTQGVRVMSLGEAERVVDVAKLAEREDPLRASLTPGVPEEGRSSVVPEESNTPAAGGDGQDPEPET